METVGKIDTSLYTAEEQKNWSEEKSKAYDNYVYHHNKILDLQDQLERDKLREDKYSIAETENRIRINKNHMKSFANQFHSMKDGGMIYIHEGKEYTPQQLIDFAEEASYYDRQDAGDDEHITNIRDAIRYLGQEEVGIKGLGKNKEYWVGAFENGGLAGINRQEYRKLLSKWNMLSANYRSETDSFKKAELENQIKDVEAEMKKYETEPDFTNSPENDKALEKAYDYIVETLKVQGRLLPADVLYGDGTRFKPLSFKHFTALHRQINNLVSQPDFKFEEGGYASDGEVSASGKEIPESEKALLPKSIGKSVSYIDKWHDAIHHYYIDDKRPQKDSLTNEPKPIGIWQFSKYPSGESYDNLYKSFTNLEDANIFMDYIYATDVLGKSEKNPFQMEAGKKHEGLAESTAKLMIKKGQMDPDYDWEVVPFRSLGDTYPPKPTTKYYLKGTLKSKMEAGGVLKENEIEVFLPARKNRMDDHFSKNDEPKYKEGQKVYTSYNGRPLSGTIDRIWLQDKQVSRPAKANDWGYKWMYALTDIPFRVDITAFYEDELYPSMEEMRKNVRHYITELDEEEMKSGGIVKESEVIDMMWILQNEGPRSFTNEANISIANELVNRGLAEKTGNEYGLTKVGEKELMKEGGSLPLHRIGDTDKKNKPTCNCPTMAYHNKLTDSQKEKLGNKYLAEGSTVTDNKSGVVSDIAEIRHNGFDLENQTSFEGAPKTRFHVPFEELVNKHASGDIRVGGYENTPEDHRILILVVKDIMACNIIKDKDKELQDKEQQVRQLQNELAQLNERLTTEVEEEVSVAEEMVNGGTIGEIKATKAGVVKSVRDKKGRKLNSLYVGEILYKINPASKTYTSENNKVLFKDDINGVNIKVDYDRIRAIKYWQELKTKQRLHFLIDHSEDYFDESLKDSLKDIKKFNDYKKLASAHWTALPKAVQMSIEEHVIQGTYENGGELSGYTSENEERNNGYIGDDIKSAVNGILVLIDCTEDPAEKERLRDQLKDYDYQAN